MALHNTTPHQQITALFSNSTYNIYLHYTFCRRCSSTQIKHESIPTVFKPCVCTRNSGKYLHSHKHIPPRPPRAASAHTMDETTKTNAHTNITVEITDKNHTTTKTTPSHPTCIQYEIVVVNKKHTQSPILVVIVRGIG